MRIVNSGYDYRHSADFKIARPNGSGDYMLLVLRSPARFWLNGKEQITGDDGVILYQKGTPQCYAAVGELFVNDWIHFDIEGDEARWLCDLGIPFDTVLSCSGTAQLSSLIKSACQEKYSANANAEESAVLYLRLLLLKLSDLCAAGGEGARSPWAERLERVRRRIYMYPQRDWRVGALAAELSISVSCFQHQYKSLFDTNFKRDLTAARLEYAKYLLFSTDYCVYRVAELCGYENEVHFMRVFKQQTGVTPSAYRKQANFSEQKNADAHQRMPFAKGE